jgi:hypothetical protein
LATIVAGAFLSAQSNPAPESERLRPAHQVFDASSEAAWALVLGRMKALGIEVAKVDRANQALLTKWITVPNKKVPWLPEPEIVKSGESARIRFEVFVSPFVQPANVFAGSQVELEAGGSRLMQYNNATANRALLSQLDSAFAEAALPKHVSDGADPCRETKPGTTMVQPQKIPLSVFEIPYPASDVESRHVGPITLDLWILKAGAVDSIRLVGPAVGEHLLAAAAGATSLLLYSPPKLGGCPVAFTMKYTVNFKMP